MTTNATRARLIALAPLAACLLTLTTLPGCGEEPAPPPPPPADGQGQPAPGPPTAIGNMKKK